MLAISIGYNFLLLDISNVSYCGNKHDDQSALITLLTIVIDATDQCITATNLCELLTTFLISVTKCYSQLTLIDQVLLSLRISS